eukprot:m.177818 g.177818  ORF g.177818 m.177818 type:complete len:405 (+) comp16824_c1_seq8:234-1448(+)
MAALRVEMTADAHLVCLTHAMTTGKEEIAGLLLGLLEDGTTGPLAIVTDVFITVRKDRRPDRVEISPEQLSAGSHHAEARAEQTGLPIRVLGWYHSHPNLTVWPSHVDLRTQLDFQQLSQQFFGLIFSVFDSKEPKTDLCCFQSAPSPTGPTRVDVPVSIRADNFLGRDCLLALPDLLRSQAEEERATFDEINSSNGNSSAADMLHNNAVYSQALCNLLDKVAEPLLSLLTTTPPAVSTTTTTGSSHSKPSSHGSAWQRLSTPASSVLRATEASSEAHLAAARQDGQGGSQGLHSTPVDKNSQHHDSRLHAGSSTQAGLDITVSGTPGQWPPPSLPSQERQQASLLQVNSHNEIRYSPYRPDNDDNDDTVGLSQGLLANSPNVLDQTTVGNTGFGTPATLEESP